MAMPPPGKNQTPSPPRQLRCPTSNYAQSVHQLMALSGDLVRMLEKRDNAFSVETRGRLSSLRDALYTDLLSTWSCADLRKTMERFCEAIISVVVMRSSPSGSSLYDPLQAVLIRMSQVKEGLAGLPSCPVCCFE
ncbi:viral protein 7 [Quaranjavirus johnstonense]|uniref:Viral protein 7 n=1 Tax=Quaranjavirus johnstonense TaxID=688437 RepID=A0A6B9XJV3_9ORTO|nr:viral protein 7 [Quaranjavirus johnstonense]QHR77130.1 viral protein 7 [Quaranjavirus johnstonense]